MKRFLTENSTAMRLMRTILQGLLGVIIANIDLLVGRSAIVPEFRPFIVALVMAVLSPIMSELGKKGEENEL